MTKRDTKVHSKWACSSCDWTYEAPLVDQVVTVHRATDKGRTVYHKVKRTWESKYNRLARTGKT